MSEKKIRYQYLQNKKKKPGPRFGVRKERKKERKNERKKERKKEKKKKEDVEFYCNGEGGVGKDGTKKKCRIWKDKAINGGKRQEGGCGGGEGNKKKKK